MKPKFTGENGNFCYFYEAVLKIKTVSKFWLHGCFDLWPIISVELTIPVIDSNGIDRQ